MVVPGRAASRSKMVKPSSAVESVRLAVSGVCVTGKSVWVRETSVAVEGSVEACGMGAKKGLCKLWGEEFSEVCGHDAEGQH